MFNLQRQAPTLHAGACLLLFLVVACGQHYSEKEPDAALAERGLVPLRQEADPHAGIQIPGTSGAALEEGQVRIGDLMAVLPAGWVSQPPSGSMRVAQFSVSDGAGAQAEMAVFSGNWGSVDDNVARWVGQFTQPDGSSTDAATQRWETRSTGGISITVVDIPGTYGGGMGGGTAQTNYRMLGAIVPAAGTFYYLKFTGPADLIIAQRKAFDALIQSLSVS